MANPFREAEKKAKVAPGSHKNPVVEKKEEKVAPVVAETAVEPVKEAPAAPVTKVEAEPVKEQPKPEKKPSKTANKIEALLGPAQKAKKQERSTMAVYLSKENQNWLKELANQRGKSVSELLDQILNELRG
jgi:hypothetical protein